MGESGKGRAVILSRADRVRQPAVQAPMTPAPIIRSLLDTDLYKFTMLQAFLHQFPGATGVYRFKCRGGAQRPLASFRDRVSEQVDHLCTLRFQPEELAYLRGLRFIK